jgi:hypothetical protein
VRTAFVNAFYLMLCFDIISIVISPKSYFLK